jgi:hypothetical protein
MRLPPNLTILLPLLLGLIASGLTAYADGMVFPQQFLPKVEIPDQQALIHFSGDTEELVIETCFTGEGTNFAWVVPLPSPPVVKPVSEGFFPALRKAFEPRLLHEVHPYFFTVLFVCGMAWLGARALKNETSWFADLPWCGLLALSAWLIGGHLLVGLLALVLAVSTRAFARSPAVFALLLLIGTVFSTTLTLSWHARGFGLVQTMGGSDSSASEANSGGVSVVSVQRAGVFDAITIRGTTAVAVQDWLVRNGYQVSPAAEPVFRRYVEQGWVFVAARVRRDSAGQQHSALHPLLFTFATTSPIYPTRLTAVDNGACRMDLYIFGPRRASAPHFSAQRCDRVISNPSETAANLAHGLRIRDSEIQSLIGDAAMGTKLSARLTPKQMGVDIKIGTSLLGRTGNWVFSYRGAAIATLNVMAPVAIIGWLLIGSFRNAWETERKRIWRSRAYLLLSVLLLGIAFFSLLPKTEIESTSPIYGEKAD